MGTILACRCESMPYGNPTETPMTLRPRRSALYMPGSNPRALEKAKRLAADVLILDLEDSVAPEAKQTARAQVVQTVRAGGFGDREILIRINALETPWGADDLVAALTAGADAVLAASLFHFGELTIGAVKAALAAAGYPVRPSWKKETADAD